MYTYAGLIILHTYIDAGLAESVGEVFDACGDLYAPMNIHTHMGM